MGILIRTKIPYAARCFSVQYFAMLILGEEVLNLNVVFFDANVFHDPFLQFAGTSWYSWFCVSDTAKLIQI